MSTPTKRRPSSSSSTTAAGSRARSFLPTATTTSAPPLGIPLLQLHCLGAVGHMATALDPTGVNSSGSRKRKCAAAGLASLHDDMLERVLARLPPATFFRLRAFSRRWRHAAASATFRAACAGVPDRDPWFLMLSDTNPSSDHDATKDPHSDEPARSPGAAVVFDSGERAWARWRGGAPAGRGTVPVASAGGLVLYRDQTSGDLTVANPLTGATRALPSPPPAASTTALHAVAMYGSPYRVVLFLGDLPELSMLAFDSSTNTWDAEPVALTRQHPAQHQHDAEPEDDDDGGGAVYFLSKSGDVVVSTTTYRAPSRQYACAVTRRRSGPTTNDDDGSAEAVVAHFLSRSGTVVTVDVARRAFAELPRVHPARHEHAIDVVACGPACYAVVLSEFLGAASLRVWEFVVGGGGWRQVAAMPPAMASAFVGAKADVNCAGHGDRIMVCVTGSGEANVNGCFLCDVKSNRWEELPRCVVGGDDDGGDLVAAVSLEPRMEAAV